MKQPAIVLSILLAIFSLPMLLDARGPTAPTARAVEHNNRGAKLLDQGQFEQAEQELKTAVELSPDYAEAYSNLGILFKKRNNLDRAMEYFQKAAGINPDYASAFNHIAAVHIARGEFDLAVKAADRAIKKEPTFAEAIYNKGLAYFLKGQQETKPEARKSLFQQAEREFSKATQLNPRLTIAHKNMGDLYTQLGNYEQAVIRYRLAVEDDPRSVETWEQLANAYRLMGDTAKAHNASAKAKEVAKTKQGDDAYNAGLKAITAAEEKWAAGDTKGANPLYNQAIKSFAQALIVNPTSADAAYQLGVAYQRLGETAMARKAWEQALALAPDHAGALYNLGTMESLAGNKDAAARALCRFLAIGGKQFPAEAQRIRDQLRQQGTSCPK